MDGKVRKIPAGGGPAEAVCDIWQIYGGTWGRNDLIVFATGARGLYKVPASGGTPVRIPTPEKVGADYRRPSFLPDGKHLLATNNTSGGIFAVSIETGEVQPVLPSETGPALYADPGYLLFLQGDSLMAQPFDLRSLHVSGSAQRVAESLFQRRTKLLHCSRRTPDVSTRLPNAADLDGTGWQRALYGGENGFVTSPYISPNGKFAIATVTDPRQGKQKLWLYDLTRGTATPFTFGEGNDLYPTWSPDSQQVAFCSTRGGQEEST